MPQSPTMTARSRPKRPATASTASPKAGRVGRVPRKRPDRDRGPVGGRDEGEFDLPAAFLLVPGIPEGGQFAAPAFDPGRAQAEQRHPTRVAGRVAEVAGGQGGFDLVLPSQQPVHGLVGVIRGGLADAEVSAQGDIGEPGQSRGLRRWAGQPGDDQGEGQVPLAARPAEQAGQTGLPGGGPDRGHGAMAQRVAGLDGVDRPAQAGAAVEDGFEGLDDVRRLAGQGGHGVVADPRAVPVGLAQQDGLVDASAAVFPLPRRLNPDYPNRAMRLNHTHIIRHYPRHTNPTRYIYLSTLSVHRRHVAPSHTTKPTPNQT
jgi:hypothetical protein